MRYDVIINADKKCMLAINSTAWTPTPLPLPCPIILILKGKRSSGNRATPSVYLREKKGCREDTGLVVHRNAHYDSSV